MSDLSVIPGFEFGWFYQLLQNDVELGDERKGNGVISLPPSPAGINYWSDLRRCSSCFPEKSQILLGFLFSLDLSRVIPISCALI